MTPELVPRQDPIAFARLVAANQSTVMGLGQALGLRGADLDDAAAEAFAAVYLALPGFNDRAALTTWVYRIAYRVMVKARAKQRRRRPREITVEPCATYPDPSGDMEAREAASALWSAVEQLGERQAAAVDLFYRHDWPLDQIAGALGCPIGTVKTLLYRARQRLKVVLAAQEVHQ